MDNIKLGKGRFQIRPVLNLLQRNEDDFNSICEKWEAFGYNIGLTDVEIDHVQEKLDSEILTRMEIPRELLRAWGNGHPNEANLKELYEALLDINLHDLAGSIRDEFAVRPGAEPEAVVQCLEVPTASTSTGRKRISSEVQVRESASSSSAAVLRLEAPSASKSKRSKRSAREDPNNSSPDPSLSSEDLNLNSPDRHGKFPLLRAIFAGKDVAFIERLLASGADVNIKSKTRKGNAAHILIWSLNDKQRDLASAIDICNLLFSHGFNLVNHGDRFGCPALQYATLIKDLDPALLRVFHEHGADMNVTDNDGDTVLFDAVTNGHGQRIIEKVIEYGGNPGHINNSGQTIVHAAAEYGNEWALNRFINEENINATEALNNTPAHYLFAHEGLEYLNCLQLLLRKGADLFQVKNKEGHVSLLEWIANKNANHANPFPTLLKIKDRFEIPQEVANQALTALVKSTDFPEVDNALPCSSDQPANERVQFIMFLIDEKLAKLSFKDGVAWKRGMKHSAQIAYIMLEPMCLEAITQRMEWKYEGAESLPKNLGKLVFLSDGGGLRVPWEYVLAGLLMSRNYDGFATVCKFISKFCL